MCIILVTFIWALLLLWSWICCSIPMSCVSTLLELPCSVGWGPLCSHSSVNSSSVLCTWLVLSSQVLYVSLYIWNFLPTIFCELYSGKLSWSLSWSYRSFIDTAIIYPSSCAWSKFPISSVFHSFRDSDFPYRGFLSSWLLYWNPLFLVFLSVSFVLLRQGGIYHLAKHRDERHVPSHLALYYMFTLQFWL